VAANEFPVQGRVRGEKRDGRTAARVLPAVHDTVQPDHAESQPAESVPGEPETGRAGVQVAGGQQERDVLQGRGGGRAAAGGRHDGVAERRAEHVAVRAGHVHRFVERPEPETETVHAVADIRRARAQRGPDRVRVLFLRAAHGGRGLRGVGPVVTDGQPAGAVSGRIRLRGGHKHGQ